MNYNTTELNFNIPENVNSKWQEILNIMAQIIDVPAALIMKVDLTDIKVYLSSDVKNNPYTPGDSEKLIDSGLYCETVIKKREKLKVPNALEDEEWKNNPDVDLNMISYLGFPIIAPDNKVFGTLCVLDTKTNYYSKLYEKLIKKFKESIESDLQLLMKNHLIKKKNKELKKYISEIKELKGIIPICSNCNKIRDDDGYWQRVENYIQTHSDAQFSHGLCPECRSELYPDSD